MTHDSRLVRAVFAALSRLAGLTRVFTAEDKHACFFFKHRGCDADSLGLGASRFRFVAIGALFFEGIQP